MKVLIKVTRRTEYAKQVEMSDADFKAYSDALESDNRNLQKSAERQLNNQIKPEDWQDDDLIEVEIEALKEAGE